MPSCPYTAGGCPGNVEEIFIIGDGRSSMDPNGNIANIP